MFKPLEDPWARFGHDDEIQRLLEEKQRLHKAYQDDTCSVSKKAAYNINCKTVETKFRNMQDSG